VSVKKTSKRFIKNPTPGQTSNQDENAIDRESYETNSIPPIFSSLAAALVFASGGQGGALFEKTAPVKHLDPVKHRQKLFIIAAKGEKYVFCLHPGPDHVK
jgi:hypothetical protein